MQKTSLSIFQICFSKPGRSSFTPNHLDNAGLTDQKIQNPKKNLLNFFLVENDGLGYSYDISIVKPGKKHFKMDFMGRANLAPLGRIPKKIP